MKRSLIHRKYSRYEGINRALDSNQFFHSDRLKVPVALRILIDSTIRAELAHLRREKEKGFWSMVNLVEQRACTHLGSRPNRLLNPLILVKVCLIYHCKSSDI